MEELEQLLESHEEDYKSKTSKDGRSRTWMILTYEDNNQFDNVISALDELDFNYAGRSHDKEGKPHHHIVVVFKDGRKRTDVAKDVGIDPRWLRAWDRKKKAFRYLCHKDNPERYQYTTDEIYGNLAEDAIKACNSGDAATEASAVAEIIELLDSCPYQVSYGWFIGKCAELGLWSTLRRMGNLACKMIDEHNEMYRFSE